MGATTKQLQDKLNMANKTVAELMEQNALLTDDLQNANHDIHNLIKSVNDVSAENYAQKAEIERTNRHINLAENQRNKEQQPLVVNHYHNCTINK
jgi:septal ring factor EnvC (AmiA/AmiB activator)